MAKNEDNKSYLQLESVKFTKMNPNYLISRTKYISFIVIYFSEITAVVPMVTRILKHFRSTDEKKRIIIKTTLIVII